MTLHLTPDESDPHHHFNYENLKSHDKENLLEKLNSHVMYTTVFECVCVRLAVLQELNRQHVHEKMIGVCFLTGSGHMPFIPFTSS
jgi:hypothetical protein